MNNVKLNGDLVSLAGQLPIIGSTAPYFVLTANDLSQVTLQDFVGKKKILNVFLSIDTPVCAASTRKFNEIAVSHADTIVLTISADLPFAQARFCAAEGIENVKTLSTFRSGNFARDYGLEIVSGPLIGLCTRAVIVLDEMNIVKHVQLVAEITSEPNYSQVLAAL
ncbi:thiol peroxidase [Iodobacter fluviatilis]|uniref:Probable thiol peroxidase n=1 Tax=Iodobacter fluviatilis TaxID=537 RepID=A0A377Q5F2_9NEIS|nr:thiol peroxidase [Iodobacter fluviatilis]TCU81185.1 thiol peroxidase (atypical 2-Cys peroxiredoxin) [Iodobacter fluviatilis]STQ90163.1 Probable thiol peroxidase [Iodobacter fluviatilis]